ncbi:MAG: ArsR/SmtB family transcription factor [Gemmatimonadaceae bacterium]
MLPPDAAARAALVLADPTRVRLLRALLDGDATVSELAGRLGLAQPRVSTHLAHLRDAGIARTTADGRQRTYHVDAALVTNALAALAALDGGIERAGHPRRSADASREVRRDSALRQARSCYDHLAGVEGVRLLDAMLHRRWLTRGNEAGRVTYELTARGADALRHRGIADTAALRSKRRSFAHACLDWTERRPHLGGALGAALLDALFADRIVQRDRSTRALKINAPLDGWLA